MVATLDTFTNVPVDQRIRQPFNPRNSPWVYYRLGKRFGRREGWLLAAQAHAEAAQHNAMKGMVPLYDYGQFFDEQPGWAITQDPFRQILLRGGAHEFPVSQVLENDWHRNPPVYDGRVVQFPQLERDAEGNVVLERGADGTPTKVHHDFTCGYCGAVRRSAELLRKHEGTVHKEIAQNADLSRGMAVATQATAQVTAEALAAVVAKLSENQAFLAAQMAETQATTNRLLAEFINRDDARKGGKPHAG